MGDEQESASSQSPGPSWQPRRAVASGNMLQMIADRCRSRIKVPLPIELGVRLL